MKHALLIVVLALVSGCGFTKSVDKVLGTPTGTLGHIGTVVGSAGLIKHFSEEYVRQTAEAYREVNKNRR